MRVIDIGDAKINLSKLLDRVAAGECVVINKSGTPIARLVPYSNTKAAARRQIKGGGFRLQGQSDRPLTPEYLKEIAASKYDG